MPSRKAIIAEILTSMRQYDESGLIDYVSLNRWIKNELKRFGANIMQLTERVIHVRNGQADLPENFFSLDFAVKCEQDSYFVEEECREQINSSQEWKTRTETLYEWDNQSNSHKGVDYKCITEKVSVENCTATIRYKSPQMLKLTKGIKREYCANACKNLYVRQAPHEINIQMNKMQFNFKKGHIYMQYYGLPVDDDGDLWIPEMRNLEEYLIAYCRMKILEDVYYNDEDVNVINKLQLAKQEVSSLYGMAQTQVKFEALSKDWDKKIKNKNRRETLKYENLFP